MIDTGRVSNTRRQMERRYEPQIALDILAACPEAAQEKGEDGLLAAEFAVKHKASHEVIRALSTAASGRARVRYDSTRQEYYYLDSDGHELRAQ